MKGSPTLTIRLSPEIIEKLDAIGEKAVVARNYIIAGLNQTETQLKNDIIYLVEFFNDGGSKTNLSRDQLEKIKSIYARATQ